MTIGTGLAVIGLAGAFVALAIFAPNILSGTAIFVCIMAVILFVL